MSPPAGVDAVFDPIGGSHFTQSYYCLRAGGSFVAFGTQILNTIVTVN
jgi:NADPH:quinone reductase-like Zn-dependent oxidoreductase